MGIETPVTQGISPLADPPPDATSDGRERRVDERLGAIVAVELCVCEATTGATLAGPMHALVTDASASGLRVELIGPAAAALAVFASELKSVTITFLLSSLHGLGPLSCEVRWTKVSNGVHCLGLEVVGKSLAGQVLDVLGATSLPAQARRSAIKVGLAAAVALLFAGLTGMSIDNYVTQNTLRERLNTAEARALTLESNAAQAQVQMIRLQDEALACAEARAQEEAEAEGRTATTEDGTATKTAPIDAPAPAAQ